ncbi:hypothetical protein [Glaciibacter sp. 2TAF33]|uniref:hypothetical protein n=1 Tax=Glaciibacter sp. 2TAF33 TaxID=3233015 RepID=UPI003F9040EC
MSDPEGQKSEGGLGKDGTIPNSDTGVAAGYQPGGSHFEPEEDGPLEDAGDGAVGDHTAADGAAHTADALDADADADAVDENPVRNDVDADDDIPSHDPEAPGDPSLDDL